jgi:hypothetical protein
MGVGKIGPKLNGPRDQRKSAIIAPSLAMEGTQQMQRLGVLRLAGQDVPIETFGAFQVPCLVLLNGKLEELPTIHVDNRFLHAIPAST